MPVSNKKRVLLKAPAPRKIFSFLILQIIRVKTDLHAQKERVTKSVQINGVLNSESAVPEENGNYIVLIQQCRRGTRRVLCYWRVLPRPSATRRRARPSSHVSP